MDADANGLVSREEFHRTMRRLGLGLTPEQIDGMLNVFDEDHSGRLDKKEFIHCKTKRSEAFCNMNKSLLSLNKKIISSEIKFLLYLTTEIKDTINIEKGNLL